MPVDLSGLHLDAGVAKLLDRTRIATLILNDVTASDDFTIGEHGEFAQINIAASVFRGDLRITANVSDILAIKDSKIFGSLVIASRSPIHLATEALVVRGNLAFSSNQSSDTASVNIRKTLVAGDVRIPAETRLHDFEASTFRVRGDFTITTTGSSYIVLRNSRFRSDASFNSGNKKSNILVESTDFGSTLHIKGKWNDILIGQDSTLAWISLDSLIVHKVHIYRSIVGRVDQIPGTNRIGELNFSKCTVNTTANFDGASISTLICAASNFGLLSLIKCQITKSISMELGTTIGFLDLRCDVQETSDVQYLPATSFRDVAFGHSRFSNRIFSDPVSFEGCTFESAPNFFGCTFQEAVVFPKSIHNYRITSAIDESLYRKLRQIMEDRRDRAVEGLFFSLEQASAHRSLPTWSADKLLSWFYGKTSCYGLSLARTLLSLFLVFSAFAVGYYVAPRLLGGNIHLDLTNSVAMSMRQTFLPFFSLRTENWGIGWYLAWLTQSMTSIALIAETLIIVRWKFRRG